MKFGTKKSFNNSERTHQLPSTELCSHKLKKGMLQYIAAIMNHTVTVTVQSSKFSKLTLQLHSGYILFWNSSFSCFCKRWQKSETKAGSTFDLSVVLSDYTAGSQTILHHRGAATGATHSVHTFTSLGCWMPFFAMKCSKWKTQTKKGLYMSHVITAIGRNICFSIHVHKQNCSQNFICTQEL